MGVRNATMTPQVEYVRSEGGPDPKVAVQIRAILQTHEREGFSVADFLFLVKCLVSELLDFAAFVPNHCANGFEETDLI